MSKTKFKYNINHQIGLLPRELSIGDILTVFEKAGISKDNFYRDRNITIGSEQSIPADRLFIYADLFACSIDELVNRERSHSSILSSLSKKKVHSTVKFKTGLS